MTLIGYVTFGSSWAQIRTIWEAKAMSSGQSRRRLSGSQREQTPLRAALGCRSNLGNVDTVQGSHAHSENTSCLTEVQKLVSSKAMWAATGFKEPMPLSLAFAPTGHRAKGHHHTEGFQSLGRS